MGEALQVCLHSAAIGALGLVEEEEEREFLGVSCIHAALLDLGPVMQMLRVFREAGHVMGGSVIGSTKMC